jgi:hypothetical protein
VRVFKEIRLAYVSNAVIGIVAERRSQRILQDCRGLASNLNRLGVDDSIIQGILRHSTVSVTQKSLHQNGAPGHNCSNAETVGCLIVLRLCSN